MKSNYKKLGQYIKQVKLKNKGLITTDLKGINIEKNFMPSVANTTGTDLSKYRVVSKYQFAFNPMHVGRDEVLPISMLNSEDNIIVSPAYIVFEVKDHEVLNPEYLMMWFRRKEFDRNAWFTTDNSVRGGFNWADFCEMTLPIPSIEKQREIVAEYNAVIDRIKLNEQMNEKLEQTAQAIFKQWFVDFEFPISKEYALSINKPELEGKPYKSSGGEMVYNEYFDKDIPLEFYVDKICSYSSLISGYAFKSSMWKTSGQPVFKIGSIQKNTISSNDVAYISNSNTSNFDKFVTIRGDLIIAMTGATIGKVAIIPQKFSGGIINQRVGLFKLAKNPINKLPFIYLNVKSNYFQNEILGVGGDSAQSNISATQIENINIIFPNNELIKMFNNYLSKAFSKLISNYDISYSLEELSRTLLSKMATIED